MFCFPYWFLLHFFYYRIRFFFTTNDLNLISMYQIYYTILFLSVLIFLFNYWNIYWICFVEYFTCRIKPGWFFKRKTSNINNFHFQRKTCLTSHLMAHYTKLIVYSITNTLIICLLYILLFFNSNVIFKLYTAYVMCRSLFELVFFSFQSNKKNGQYQWNPYIKYNNVSLYSDFYRL